MYTIIRAKDASFFSSFYRTVVVLSRNGGKPPKLTVEDKLYITLKYLREYRTMESIGADYGVGKSAACEAMQWVEDTLVKDRTFRLPDKKALKKESASIEYIVVDVTESPINRPKKTRKSGIRARKSAGGINADDKNAGHYRAENPENH